MAIREGTGRRNSTNDASVEQSAPSSSKPPPTRRPGFEDLDVLTPEEEYLLRVFQRYRKDTPVSPNLGEKVSDKCSASPNPEGGMRKASPLPTSSPYSNGTNPTTGGVPRAKEVSPQPTDPTSKLKMLLEKKRKEQASSRIGVASSGGGTLKKAKMNKVFGATSSATSAKLDAVKYPPTGLLLLGEFRTFEEGEEDGERAYNPTEPLVRDLKNFGVADSSTKKQFNETLVMRITVPAHSQSWGINISPADHEDFSQVLFHFNPRRRFVAMNSRKDNIWGQQEKYMVQRWPELFSVSVTLAIQIDKIGFRVAINGKYCATFAHRGDLASNGDQLVLQIMTCDDYGMNLGLVVHEIWWGHKDTMPGLPEERTERQVSSDGPVSSDRPSEHRRGGEAEEAFTDLHIGNLPPMPTPEEQEAMRKRLLDLFEPYGAIQVRVFHREKFYGFVKFREHGGAIKALEELSGEEIQGRSIRLSKAASR